jgi:hypothetical protein
VTPQFTPPSPSERTLLVAAIGPAALAASAWDTWYAGVVLEDVPYHEARLLPQVFANLHAQGEAGRLPPRLRGKYRWVWASNKLRVDGTGPAVAALHARSIPVLALKGAAMLAGGIVEWGAREMGDVDLAVPADRLYEAGRALERAGWWGRNAVSADTLARRLRDRRHSWNFDRGEHQQVDLHWHVLAMRPDPATDDSIWARAHSVSLGQHEVFAPDDLDLFVHVVEHASRNEPMNRLAWVVDAARLLVRVDADDLVVRVRELGLTATVATACDVLGDALGTVGPHDPRALAARVRSWPLPAVESVLAWTREPHVGRWPVPRVGEQVRTAALHAPGASPREGVRGFVRRRVEPSLWRNRWVGAAVHLAGGARRPQMLALRRFGPLARPPAATPLVPGEWVVLNTGAALDRVAGPGWSWPQDDGVWGEGIEARLVVDAPMPRGRGLTLEFAGGDQVADGPTPMVRVFVNERPVADWDVHHAFAEGPVTVDVPAWLADWCWPLEVTFRPLETFPTGARDGDAGDLRPFLFLRGFRVQAPTIGTA